MLNNDVFEKREPRIMKCTVKETWKLKNASQELRIVLLKKLGNEKMRAKNYEIMKYLCNGSRSTFRLGDRPHGNGKMRA